MLEKNNCLLEKPELFKTGEILFWEDEYISRQLLNAHLNPSIDSASRKIDFIEKSVEWIFKIASPLTNPLLLDLGCGPGLYAEKFSQLGYDVTGIDISKNSIKYAKNSALSKNLNINYLVCDYLKLNYKNSFDLATLIYCDYGALSDLNRKLLLEKIYLALKPKGRLLFDVFSTRKFHYFSENKTWNVFKNNGFWSPHKYLELIARYKYPNYITLEHYTIITNKNTKSYYVWNSHFNRETLIKECRDAGFNILDIYGNVAGEKYTENSNTIAILLEKPL
ncbi:Ubiquinone/menaquinone biosynthesis C-methylase UbiE [Anaerosphaera aminiphila DSM 21120]|uniref:Ubiquinone/menaquinone biosynthesis C-methylase UbiE n=1 Tax=Anaerosphaera aminiphila DSM 21120 TaxID=1120995 RepID=A0A1M5PSJ9_9FIRM|nr:class I SAM-dependent methyltransferase [Anaerosphaera aminiphila]SHH04546.1 Ubiquinone/menaquinone biosynthesis C-methylase UbiE [Anaerosphaera aminiphila DSM 21120]